ncbi:MAG: hypothetical protein U0457_21765 [Candidatus Sericytochromatia bacterium]
MQIKFIFIFIYIFSLISNSYANPNVNQQIKLDDIIFKKDNEVGLNLLPKLNVPIKFRNFIGYSRKEIMSLQQKNLLIQIKSYSFIKYKNYNIDIYYSYYGFNNVGLFKDEGIYVFDKNDICIGYAAIMNGENIESLNNTNIIKNLKKLSENKNYLDNKLLKPRKEINFYEYEHDSYIERFGLNDKLLFLDSFYPKEFEDFMSEKILEILNFNYTAKDKIKDYKNMSDSDFNNYKNEYIKKDYIENTEQKEERISTKNRFAIAVPPEIQYSFTDNFDLGIEFNWLLSYGYEGKNFKDLSFPSNFLNIDLKYSFYRIENTKFLFDLNFNKIGYFFKSPQFDYNLINKNLNIARASFFIGFESFLNKNISIDSNIGFSIFKNSFILDKIESGTILLRPDYNIKAYYYF